MRELKFRAKLLFNGTIGSDKWVISSNIRQTKHGFFINGQQADPETVGQYIGLKDRNGVEIYDGDIVRVSEFIDRGYGDYDDEIFIVQWNHEYCAFTFFETLSPLPENWYAEDVIPCEVIGNIHEQEADDE